MSLEDFPNNQANNVVLFGRYRSGLAAIPGLSLLEPAGVTSSNYQYCVCVVDQSTFGLPRDLLIDLLWAENVVARRYFYPGAHRSIPYAQERPQYLGSLPHTDRICSTCVQFPIGALATESDVDTICDLLARYQKNARIIVNASANRGRTLALT
jgi:dTDP-4-amino-4,6-dideoxygalactose transaminase